MSQDIQPETVEVEVELNDEEMAEISGGNGHIGHPGPQV